MLKKSIVCVFVISSFLTTAFATVRIGPFINSGYVTAYLYPSHNEFDPNQGIFPFPDRPVARYGLEVYTKLALVRFPKIYVYGDLLSLFGDSFPQTDYNYKATPIVGISEAGVGYKITKHLDAGLESSMHWKYSNNYKGEALMWSAVTMTAHW
jgi:hypothetical protein